MICRHVFFFDISVYLFLFKYESVNANFDDMGCTWNAGHVICMISSTSRGKP